MMVACSSEKTTKENNGPKDGDAAAEEAAAAPAYVVEKVTYADSIDYSGSKAVAKCTVGYIKSADGETALTNSVNSWVVKMLSMSGTSVEMGQPLAKAVVSKTLKDNAGDLKDWADMAKEDADMYPPMTYEFTYDVQPLVVNPQYVTMVFESYAYTGGAHGGAATIGQTFVSATGEKLGEDMFKPGTQDQILKLVRAGLMKQYFEVATEQEFKECLMDPDGALTLPSNPPYFTKDGVTFMYQQYEIAPYSSGMPNCVIPFDTIKPYLTDQALSLIEE